MKDRETVLNEAITASAGKRRCSLSISMGVGKTHIGLYHMDSYKFRSDTPEHFFLVVIPKLSVKQTWLDEMDKHGLSHLKDYVTFTTYRSLHKQSHVYHCVYLDEVHSLLPSHVKWLSAYTNDILGLTGTPPTNRKSNKYELIKVFCPIVYEYLVDEAVNDSILNDYQIIIHELELSDHTHVVSLPNGARYRTTEVETYDRLMRKIDNAEGFKEREKAYIILLKNLMEFKTKEEYTEKLLKYIPEKCIVFANNQKQAEALATYTYHSANPNSKRNLEWFNYGKISKLACVNQLNEGINIQDLKNGIIMHSYANERRTAQRIGRLLRLPIDETATIHILVYKNTIDEIWLKNALKQFDQEKIYYALTEKIV